MATSPTPSSEQALARMRRQVRRDTRPEMLLRRALHRRGLRYRVDRSVVPGSRARHDIVFTRARVVVEVRGCFWHSCALHGTIPKANRTWWIQKLGSNVRRDLSSRHALEASGWAVLVVWEHDDPEDAADRVERLVRRRRIRLGAVKHRA